MLLGILVVISAGICVYAIRQVDPDLYGYFAYGRLFAARGPVDIDPFAYTSSGFHWVAFEYLAQLWLWTAYDHFGPLGLIGLKAIVGGCAVFFLWVTLRTSSDDPIVWVPVFLLSTSTLSRFFLFRPQLFTFACFALFVAVLLRFVLRDKAALWCLPVVMLLWANVHGGFLAGLGAVFLAGLLRVCENLNRAGSSIRSAGAGTRPLVLAFAACVLVSFVNPHGDDLWRYVLTEVTHGTNRRYIAEWQPVSWERDPWSATALTFITLMVIGVGWIAQRRHLTIAGIFPWQWVVSCGPLLIMAYASVRHVPLAAIWTAPVIALLGSAVSRSGVSRSIGRLWLAVSAVTVIPLVLTVEYVVQHPWPSVATGGNVLGSKHPCRVVGFMRENRLEGNVYNPLWWGGYLTWEAYPTLRVSMDGRNISLFSREMVEQNLRFYSREATLDDLDIPLGYDTDFLLMPADTAILDTIRADARWREMYADGDASVFVRANGAHQALLSLVQEGALAAPGPCSQTLAGEHRP